MKVWRSRTCKLTSLVVLGASAVLSGCSGEAPMPGFANPASAEGFIELATGSGWEKEPSTFWLYGGRMEFASWKSEAIKSFDEHGWHTGPASGTPVSTFELHASSPDRSLCISYYDFQADAPPIQSLKRALSLAYPLALAKGSAFESTLFVSAGICP